MLNVKTQLFTDTFQLPKRASAVQVQPRPDGRFDRKAYANAYIRMDRKRRKANGTCKGCQEPAIPGQLRCTTCTEQHRQKGLTYRERLKGSAIDSELRENRSRKGTEARKRHKKLGRCVRCPNPSIPEETLCTTCRKKHLEWSLAYRRNHKAQAPQPLTEGNTSQQTFELTKPKPKPKKATKPNFRKPNAGNPGVPTKTVEERIESRREYDRTRGQTDERKKFDRLYKQKVRQERKAAGLCKTCPNPTIPGQTRCESCRDKHRASR